LGVGGGGIPIPGVAPIVAVGEMITIPNKLGVLGVLGV
jgi:hypothetical protein